MVQLQFVGHRWNCHTHKFDSCAYCSGEIHVLQISHHSISFPRDTDTVCTLLY